MTALEPAAAHRTAAAEAWPWPIDPARYDRRSRLTELELDGIRELGSELLHRTRGGANNLDSVRHASLRRLLRPLDDAQAALHWVPGRRARQRFARDAAALVLIRCGDLGRSFWDWSEQDWIDLIDPDGENFRRTWPGQIGANVRPFLIAFAYLFGEFTAFDRIGRFHRPSLAWRIFGREPVDGAIGQIREVLTGWGYTVREGYLAASVCQMLLLNRSPRPQDLSTSMLLRLRVDPAMGGQQDVLHGVHRALAALGFVDPAPAPVHSPGPFAIEGTSPAWAEWVERWYATSTLTPKVRASYRAVLSKIGRWLVAEHPDVTEPAQWTREICASWVAAVDRMAVGDHVQWIDGMRARAGEPIKAETKSGYLGKTRTFFRDLQEWEWIPRRFDVTTALKTPRSVKALIGPDPRVIADDIWAKLLWAGLNLAEDDRPTGDTRAHPMELIRAITLTWLFAGQRSDEIARLRLGCIRWHHDGMPIPGDSDEVLARDAVCLLDVPTHKTGTAFTKPVDPLLGQAIEAWQAARPIQPKLLDRKTGEQVDFLFAFRARRVSKHYINDSIIPMLCAKAGVPAVDVRGNITSHRARSTIASQLYNAKEPMTLFELQAWLGHRDLKSTQHYAKITPNTLSKAYRDAGYFERNVRTIEILIDRDAVTSGAAATGEPWQYYDLGHGFCTYTFFEQCAHRMACAKCDFYTPKDSSKAQLLEAKDNLQRMLAAIPLTDDERAAVDDGQAALDQLLSRLSDVPTPAGPTPHQLGIPVTATLLPIVDVRQGPPRSAD
ncbi:tyrosine-type recombinase/integrase [Nonomuraea sp. NPDC049129]|uniref:tyrosine-type recombinase/integrase n=1 Tax=Nonomuraea sp. NPDC049129 TaxID=3155272 RepID=UPI0033F4C06B